MDIQNILFLIEIVGTISFAVSGSILAMERECDLFGVIVLGCVTAIGGGILRDILLGIHPPIAFQHPLYAIIAIVTSLFSFYLVYINKITFKKYRRLLDWADIIFDSVGLGIFVIIGINTALVHQFDSAFLVLFIGLITGIGGGVLRDMMAMKIPMVLRKRIYAVAALSGGIVYYYCIRCVAPTIAITLSASTTIIIRLLAYYYKWNLPKVKLHE
ncbi:MAG: trimeric intracellular cation channel family protein [Erysipelotrichaceae bacterium]|nr:trimeric intracellular cation channel family protein [Erysipelotrichaceae bacterium]